MDLNSRLFDSIRIKPSCDEPKAAAEAVCESPGCTHPGLYRAPKGRKAEGQYWRFCMAHVREYNAAYNYFDGMNDAAVQAYQKDAVIGHRPTWAMGVNPGAKAGAKPDQPQRDWEYVDPLGILRGDGIRCDVDARGESMGKRIRDGELAKVPYLLIVGDREVETRTASVRRRHGEQEGDVPVDALALELRTAAPTP